MTKYFTGCPAYSAPCYVVIHKDAFNELPRDLQDKVLEWAKKEQKWLDEYQKRLVADSLLEGMKRDGVHATWINPTLAETI